MEKEKNILAKPSKQELKRPFPLIQDLFALAKKKEVLGAHGEVVIELPKKFEPLVADFPGKYWVVAYEDRRDRYYKEDTRGQYVILSTVKNRSETDDITTEFEIRQRSKSTAERVEVKLKRIVMDKSFQKINEAEGEELEQSHGDTTFKYELDQDGKKYPQKLEFSRLDEGLFVIGDIAKPVRWVRRLEIEKKEGESDKTKTSYSDYYIIRENHDDPTRFPRADIKTEITGDLDTPESILVQVGSGAEESATVIVDDKAKGIKVLHYKYYEEDGSLDIAKDDPVYAFLFKKTVEIESFIEELNKRIETLKEDWDKPQSIYETAKALDQETPELSE